MRDNKRWREQFKNWKENPSSPQAQSWIGYQKREWRIGNLPYYRRKKLEALGVDPKKKFRDPLHPDVVAEYIQRFTSFKRRHGRLIIPQHRTQWHGWMWLVRIRARELTVAQWGALDDLGFDWKRNHPRVVKGQKKRYGDTLI